MTRQESSGQHETNMPSLTSRARELRHSDTLAEKLAWKLLRNRRLLRYKFRRQVQLGNAIVDFGCHSLKLVVELDGAGHAYKFRQQEIGNGTGNWRDKGIGCSVSQTVWC